jgi:NADPH-ferrihemoprotein reductase
VGSRSTSFPLQSASYRLLIISQKYSADLAPNFTLVTAFSREQAQKVYVQHRMKEHAAEINSLIQDKKANFYVCGDAAHMAREVNNVLVEIIAEQSGISTEKAEEVVKAMRSNGQYQEDVWS